MANKHKAQGSVWELWIRRKLEASGLKNLKLGEGGIYDPGDTLIPSLDLVVEARDRGVMNVHEAVRIADHKAKAQGYMGAVVFWKRKAVKEGNIRRSTVGVPVVAMPIDLFTELAYRAQVVRENLYTDPSTGLVTGGLLEEADI